MTTPWVKIAMIKWTYRQEPKGGWCAGPDSGKLKSCEDVLEAAEECLRLIHNRLPPASFKKLTAYQTAQLKSQCDLAVANGLLEPNKTASVDTRRAAIVAQFAPTLRKALKMLGENLVKEQLPSMLDITDLLDPATQIHTSGVLQPKGIRYDDEGKPLGKQDVVVVDDVERVHYFPFAEWAEQAEVKQKQMIYRAKMATVSCALTICPAAMSMLAALVKMKRCKQGLQLEAAADIPEGMLLLPVPPMDLAKLLHISAAKDAFHPNAVDVSYIVHGPGGVVREKVELKANPEFKLPKVPDDASIPIAWEPSSIPWAFWGMKRTHDEANWNCGVVPVQMQHITVASFGPMKEFQDQQNRGLTASVWLPVLTNPRKIAKGEELALKWAKPPAVESKKRVRDWVTDAMASDKKKHAAKV